MLRIPWRQVLWGDNSCRWGAPGHKTMGVVLETTLTMSTIFALSLQYNNIQGCEIKTIMLWLSHPGLGWLYVFSSFPPSLPLQQRLPLTSKPLELNLRYLAQRIYGSREMYWMTLSWPWPKVTAVASISQNLLVCAIKWEPLIGSLQIMVITWLDFGKIMLETVILAHFPKKFWMCFFKVKHNFGHISGMVGLIDVKWKESASVGYWMFELTHDLDLGCFKVKFLNSSNPGIVGLIDVKCKGSELIWYWADSLTLLFDHTHELDLGVSRPESEIALSQEWGGRLTWNVKDVGHPFMTMILTCVTKVGWLDVHENSDRGDFRHWRAIDISSCD